MYCDGLVSGSNSLGPNSNLVPLPSILPTTNSIPIRISVSSQPRFSSFRTKATINDGSVKPISASMSFYELLGIEENVTVIEIKQAYKHLARKYHPDVSPPDRVEEYTQRFIRVQEAYETLSDATLRADYDRDLARGLHLAFSAKKMSRYDEGMEDKSQWKNIWQSQLSELKKRSMYKERDNMSWGAKMRRQREGSSAYE